MSLNETFSIAKYRLYYCHYYYLLLFRMNQEGRIQSVEVCGYKKQYDPEKYYVYILKVKRENQSEPSYLLRSYKEFCELHQKICVLFPLAKCHR